MVMPSTIFYKLDDILTAFVILA